MKTGGNGEMRPSEDCPNAPADDPTHCEHWYECEPCCRCGDDTPDPMCDCPRCTYVRQETKGYDDGKYHEEPDLDAPWPSGMCGQKRVCDRCPSSFLCTIKARAEYEAIKARRAIAGPEAQP